MTANITKMNQSAREEEQAKALLLRLHIEAKYRAPNGGYVSTFHNSANTGKTTAEIALLSDLSAAVAVYDKKLINSTM